MPMYSAEGGFTGSARGSATSPSRSTSTTTRSSAPNAAAAAASNRMNSGNLGRSTPSSVGNQMGGGFGRIGTSGSGFTRNTVNAAAANAARMAAQRSAGVTSSYGAGKTGLMGANQSFNKGVNLSSGDMIRGGYGKYQSPAVGMARPAASVSYGNMFGLRNPSVSSVVAGDLQSRFGNVNTNGEIGEVMGSAGEATFNRAMANMLAAPQKDQSRVPSVSSSPTRTAAAGYRDYDPLSSVSGGPQPVAVAGYQNPAKAYPSRPAAPARQVAGYNPLSSISPQAQRPITVADVPQLPGGASTVQKGLNPSMGDFDMTAMTREPSPYDPQGPQVAAAPARTTFAQNLVSRGFTGGMAPARPGIGAESPMAGQGGSFSTPAGPGGAQAYNDAMIGSISDARFRQAMAQPASSQEPFDNTIYGDAPQNRTKIQRMADALTFKAKQKTAGVRKLGDSINRALGGKSQDDPNWTPPGNPNARDPNSNNSERVRVLVARAKEGDPEAEAELKKWFIWNQWAPGSRPGLV